MIVGRRCVSRPYRGMLVAWLSLMIFCAPLVVVCESAGHMTVEWVFSSCCAPMDVDGSAGTVVSRVATSERVGTPNGRCADACVDTLLFASAPEPTVPLSAHTPHGIAHATRTREMRAHCDSRLEPLALTPPLHLRPLTEFSAVLLI